MWYVADGMAVDLVEAKVSSSSSSVERKVRSLSEELSEVSLAAVASSGWVVQVFCCWRNKALTSSWAAEDMVPCINGRSFYPGSRVLGVGRGWFLKQRVIAMLFLLEQQE